MTIPLEHLPMTDFTDHGWRLGGKPEAFYITIDETNAIYKTQSSNDDLTEQETKYDTTEDDRS